MSQIKHIAPNPDGSDEFEEVNPDVEFEEIDDDGGDENDTEDDDDEDEHEIDDDGNDNDDGGDDEGGDDEGDDDEGGHGDDDGDDDDDDEGDEGDSKKTNPKITGGGSNNNNIMQNIIGGATEVETTEIDEDITGEANKKLVNNDNVQKYHPESHTHNYDEIHKASYVTRNEDNIIVDELHKTIPIMTKYEKAKILGQRTKQLDNGAQAFVKLEKQIMDNSLIAEEELYQKKLPFIIQRPLPGGGFEYWHVKDLEVVRDD